MIPWSEIYRDAVIKPFMQPGQERTWGQGVAAGDAKACRPIPCPGSYFPCHDDQCEMVWKDDLEIWVDCQCEPRARERRDEGQV